MVAYHGVGETLPAISKPVPLPRSRVNLPPRVQPRWRGSQAPKSAGLRPLARGVGSASPTSSANPFLRSPPCQFLDPLPPLGRRGGLAACWRMQGLHGTLLIGAR